MTYRYIRHVFRKGKLVHREEITMSGVQLYHANQGTGRSAFLELVNSWNNRGLIGMKHGGPQYLYTAT